MKIRFLMAVTLFVVALSASAFAQDVFNLPANSHWTKVQNGEVAQWAVIPLSEPQTRIDFLSVVENGRRISYYTIRKTCSDENVVQVATLLADHKLGYGQDCEGYTVRIDDSILEKVDPLPNEAAALLRQ